jgi:tetratricopeptide (TPR) repeat protein
LTGNLPPSDQVRDQLCERSLLLILDNFEQLTDDVEWLLSLLRAAADVRVLLTSREQLDVFAEVIFPLTGLSVPPATAPFSAAQNFDASRLFIERARRIDRQFRLTATNWPHLVTICCYLEGLPLGIELAVTWVQELELEDIAAAISADLDFLKTSARDVALHQRSVRHIYGASWARLSLVEQETLARLSVMRGAFDTHAAMQIAQATPLTLRRLRHKSLVRSTGIGWLDMHELVRQFSAEKLPPNADAAQRHATHYLGLVAAETQRLNTQSVVQAVQHIQANFNNIRAAWHFAVEVGMWEVLDGAVLGIGQFYVHVGLWGELDGLLYAALTQAQAATPPPAHLVASLLAQQMNMAATRKEPQGFIIAKQALDAAQTVDDPYLIAFIYAGLGRLYDFHGQFAESRAALERAYSIALTHQLPDLVMAVLDTLAHVAYIEEQHDLAQRYLEEIVTLSEQTDTGYFSLCDAVGQLGNVANRKRQFVKALHLHERYVALVCEIGDKRGEALARHWLAGSQIMLGLFDSLIASEQHAAVLLQQVGDIELESFVQHGLAEGLRLTGQLDEAHSVAQRAVELALQAGTPLSRAFAFVILGDVLFDQQQFAAAKEVRLKAKSLFAKLRYQAEIMLCDCALADIALIEGDVPTARVLIAPTVAALQSETYREWEYLPNAALACQRVLLASGESQLAAQIVRLGRDVVLESAENISDPTLRQTFLHNVPAHRELLAISIQMLE